MESVLFRPLTQDEVYCNGRIVTTPEGEPLEILWASRKIFRALEVEERNPKPRGRSFRKEREIWEAEEASAAMGDRWAAEQSEGRKRAARRAKKELYQLAMCNPFDLFITLTLDGEKVDRYNYPAVIKHLNRWLDNMVRRKGLFYIIVPELHRDGALHFHGLVNAVPFRLVDSGHKDRKGKTIYNLPDWKLGFTTAVRLDGDYEGVCHYVSKYITKQYQSEADSGGEAHRPTGRYFYRGGPLQRPRVHYVHWTERPDGRSVDVDSAGLELVYVKGV